VPLASPPQRHDQSGSAATRRRCPASARLCRPASRRRPPLLGGPAYQKDVRQPPLFCDSARLLLGTASGTHWPSGKPAPAANRFSIRMNLTVSALFSVLDQKKKCSLAVWHHLLNSSSPPSNLFIVPKFGGSNSLSLSLAHNRSVPGIFMKKIPAVGIQFQKKRSRPPGWSGHTWIFPRVGFILGSSRNLSILTTPRASPQDQRNPSAPVVDAPFPSKLDNGLRGIRTLRIEIM